jgi:hypothetical protein
MCIVRTIRNIKQVYDEQKFTLKKTVFLHVPAIVFSELQGVSVLIDVHKVVIGLCLMRMIKYVMAAVH